MDEPVLEALTRRLVQTPPEFLLLPVELNPRGQIQVGAIVCDLLRTVGAPLPTEQELQTGLTPSGRASAARLGLIGVACWLLYDECFRSRGTMALRIWPLLARELDALAELVKPEDLLRDADRREELVRVCLRHLGLRPRGETAAQATDRLAALDSAERVKVMRQMREAEARARKIREKMAEDAAKAAAARYSPE